jgi:pyruvate decarboxylase
VRFPISKADGSSIGYATPATLGAALALRELPDGAERRVILFTGEGSLQLTVQVRSRISRI